MPIPPLAAIRVFEAVARHLSFTRAAAELGMTQAAVSYQIKVLEERLGGAVFLRRTRAIELTRLGSELALPTTEAFSILRNAFEMTEGKATELSISSLASLSANWLSQRLVRFQREHPNIVVRLDTSDRNVDFAREDFDAAIRFGKGKWPGLEAHWLMDFSFAPMLSPKLMQEAAIQSPADLLRLPILDSLNPDWACWMLAECVDCPTIVPIPGIALGTQINEGRAAMAGQGVALLTPRFFKIELETGALVQPFPRIGTNGNAYWLVYPDGSRNRPAIRQFRRFLLDEIRKEEEEFPSAL